MPGHVYNQIARRLKDNGLRISYSKLDTSRWRIMLWETESIPGTIYKSRKKPKSIIEVVAETLNEAAEEAFFQWHLKKLEGLAL